MRCSSTAAPSTGPYTINGGTVAATSDTNGVVSVGAKNKERQILVARRNKERTDAVECERVEKDRMLEANERERVVSLAQIEKKLDQPNSSIQ